MIYLYNRYISCLLFREFEFLSFCVVQCLLVSVRTFGVIFQIKECAKIEESTAHSNVIAVYFSIESNFNVIL